MGGAAPVGRDLLELTIRFLTGPSNVPLAAQLATDGSAAWGDNFVVTSTNWGGSIFGLSLR
jgi:hypothetical protein